MKLTQYSSLSLRMSIASIFVISLALLVYTWLQFVADPTREIGEMLENIVWQVFLLGGLIYLSLHLVIRRVLVEPLHALYVRMYAVTRGDYRPFELETDVRELQDIAGGLNMMLTRLREDPREQSADELRTDADRLRVLAGDDACQLPEDVREWLKDVAARIDRQTHRGG